MGPSAGPLKPSAFLKPMGPGVIVPLAPSSRRPWSGGRNFPAIEFAGKKSPNLAFSNVGRYEGDESILLLEQKKNILKIKIKDSTSHISTLTTHFEGVTAEKIL